LLLPVYLLLFFGKSGNVDLGALAESIVIVLVIPFTLAVLAKTIVKSRKNLSKNNFLGFFETSQVFFLSLAVVAMFASEGKDLINHPSIIYKMLLPVLIFFFVAFLVAYFVSKMLKFNYADRVSLTLTTMARNSPISLAIAVSSIFGRTIDSFSLGNRPTDRVAYFGFDRSITFKDTKTIVGY